MLRRSVLDSHTATNSRSLSAAPISICQLVLQPQNTSRVPTASCNALQSSLQHKQRLVAVAAKPDEKQFDVDAGVPTPLDAEGFIELGPREDDVRGTSHLHTCCVLKMQTSDWRCS